MSAKSFAAILDEKLHKKSQHRPSLVQDPAFLAYLLGNIAQTRVQNRSSVKRYGAPKTPPKEHLDTEKVQNAEDMPTEEPVQEARTLHVLSEQQVKARRYFAEAGLPLAPDFLERELKGAYRKLARKLHPDICPKSEYSSGNAFIVLKSAYDELRRLFS